MILNLVFIILICVSTPELEYGRQMTSFDFIPRNLPLLAGIYSNTSPLLPVVVHVTHYTFYILLLLISYRVDSLISLPIPGDFFLIYYHIMWRLVHFQWLVGRGIICIDRSLSWKRPFSIWKLLWEYHQITRRTILADNTFPWFLREVSFNKIERFLKWETLLLPSIRSSTFCKWKTVMTSVDIK